ncbi:hypothetical protein V6N11_083620 [Hibiscus sabdariffa]|uniref:Reverse transcriptase n=1 Tax=Hibiscus sabdariffa TaxID=183260 RepID=A0ABR2QC20_9ROSI
MKGIKIRPLFFRKVKNHHKTNTIHTLQDRNEQRLETYEDISHEFVQFFIDLLGSFDDNVEVVHDDLLRKIPDAGINADMQSCLVAPITQKEIKDVVFSMNGNKAPGPDGCSARRWLMDMGGEIFQQDVL